MLAIATLVNDDPWLKMPREQRIAARRERREKFNRALPPIILVTAEPVAELPPAKEPWFHIVEEIETPHPRYPSITEILRAVANYYSLTVHDLISARRTKDLILPRHMGMYLCRSLTLRSHSCISDRFGGRDHTVSVFAANKIASLSKSDWMIAFDVAHLEAALA